LELVLVLPAVEEKEDGNCDEGVDYCADQLMQPQQVEAAYAEQTPLDEVK
jgi:hypothetical protein